MHSEIIKMPFDKRRESGIEIDIVPLSTIKKMLQTKTSGLYERLNFYLIIHFTAGSGRHFVDFKSYDYSAGSMFFLSRYQVQRWFVDNNADGYLILFTEDFLSGNKNDRQILLDYEITVQQNSPHLTCGTDSTINDSLDALKREFNKPADFAKGEILRSSLRILLLQILRYYRGMKSTVPADHDSELFHAFRRTLETNFLTIRTVSGYAGELAVGPKKLNKTVRDHTDLSVKTYIDTRIILEAKRLLSSSQITTMEVAFALEFDDPSNFVKFFKRHTGLTPSHFQDSLKH